MKIAVVGNAEPARDYSAEIDAADLVIRFNRIPFFATGLVGRRADIHAFVDAFPAGYMIAKHRMEVSAPVVWWMNHNSQIRAAIMAAHHLENKIHESFSPVRYRELREEMAVSNPSSGVRVIRKCRLKWPNATPILYCFTWQGYWGHSWAKEESHCRKLAHSGNLQIVENRGFE